MSGAEPARGQLAGELRGCRGPQCGLVGVGFGVAKADLPRRSETMLLVEPSIGYAQRIASRWHLRANLGLAALASGVAVSRVRLVFVGGAQLEVRY